MHIVTGAATDGTEDTREGQETVKCCEGAEGLEAEHGLLASLCRCIFYTSQITVSVRVETACDFCYPAMHNARFTVRVKGRQCEGHKIQPHSSAESLETDYRRQERPSGGSRLRAGAGT